MMDIKKLKKERNKFSQYSGRWEQWDNKIIKALETGFDTQALAKEYKVRRNEFSENSGLWEQWNKRLAEL